MHNVQFSCVAGNEEPAYLASVTDDPVTITMRLDDDTTSISYGCRDGSELFISGWLGEGEGLSATLTIQPGQSLWAMAGVADVSVTISMEPATDEPSDDADELPRVQRSGYAAAR